VSAPISDDPSSICYYTISGNCGRTAVVHKFCSVEGRDTHFCTEHYRMWMAETVGDEFIAKHCPRCAPAARMRREAQGHGGHVAIADEPITGPLADAVDAAMHAEGILLPVRKQVLRRLAANTDSYVAAVMARQAGSLA
jgi:hypothetical protein